MTKVTKFRIIEYRFVAMNGTARSRYRVQGFFTDKYRPEGDWYQLPNDDEFYNAFETIAQAELGISIYSYNNQPASQRTTGTEYDTISPSSN